MEPRDVLTLVIALIGASLGVLNTWRAWRQGKVRLRVIPTSVKIKRVVGRNEVGEDITRPYFSPGVRVVNLSAFSITVEEVGYELSKNERYSLSRLDKKEKWSAGGVAILPKLPEKLEARTSLQMALWDEDIDALKRRYIRRAYATTACGTTVRGRNLMLRKLARQLVLGQDVMELVEEA